MAVGLNEAHAASLAEPAAAAARLPWISVAPGAPYFVDEAGAAFTPVGQNDAISWIEFDGLMHRRDLPSIRNHLLWLKSHGVTVLRLMMEYSEEQSHYFEQQVGIPNPALVQLWDDLFALCEELELRLLLTPYDTFWMWLKWDRHPYNAVNGGPLDHPSRFLICPATRHLIKERLLFAVRRWGGSGALFAWDLWNEIHPDQAQGACEPFHGFISDLSQTVRREEQRLYGRSHPQTVSLFGPELDLRPHMDLTSPVFRHGELDFATLHIYQTAAIDNPRNTVDCAISMGAIVRQSLAEIEDGRPFLDTEHGPIHAFKDRDRILPEAFDDEYFAHMQWAHLASGGAGGGMRWPNRHPHVLTAGMRRAQRALSAFLPLIDWTRFRRRNLNAEIVTTNSNVARFGCGDAEQAVVWLMRRGPLAEDGRVAPASPTSVMVRVPNFSPGRWRITPFDTAAACTLPPLTTEARRGAVIFETPAFGRDLAFALVKL